MNQNDSRKAIENGKTTLGIEFGSTRIKGVLIGEDYAPIASGSYEWENRYENGFWTYHLDEIWTGLQACYADLNKQVEAEFGQPLQTVGAIGFSGHPLDIAPLRQRRREIDHSQHPLPSGRDHQRRES